MLNIVIPLCNPSSQKLRQEDYEFMTRLDYIGRACLSHSGKGEGA